MDIQYYCANKIYTGESIQVYDQDLSSKCGSGNSFNGTLRMKDWVYRRRHGNCRASSMSVGRQ